MPVREIRGAEDLVRAAGSKIGTSRWVVVGQHDVERFGVAVYPVQDDGFLPEGLLLARSATLMMETFSVEGRKFGLNYGVDNVRFRHRVHSGAAIRTHVVLAHCDARDDFVDTSWDLSVEATGGVGIACTLVFKTRYVF